MSFKRIASRARGWILALLVLAPLPQVAQAQQIIFDDARLRTVQVEHRVDGKIIATWPWVQRNAYFQSIVDLPLLDMVPSNRQPPGPGRDHLVVTEWSSNGATARRIILDGVHIAYSYYLYDQAYFIDRAGLGAMLEKLFAQLPPVTAPSGSALLTLERREVGGRSSIRQIDQLDVVKTLKSAIDRLASVDSIGALYLTSDFASAGRIRILVNPVLRDWPESLIYHDGQVMTVRPQIMTRVLRDRENFWGAAMAQRDIYRGFVARGITDPRLMR
jgi:hypothetical protein